MARINIAVLTYLRNEALEGLLPELLNQAGRLSGTLLDHEVNVLVVDNDPLGGAAETVTRAGRGDRRVRYVHEPTPGIAAARNRALDESPRDGVVVFIDDDETPTALWLSYLLETWSRHQSAAVGGPVAAVLPNDVDPWIVAGGFFDRDFRRSFRTGQPVAVAPTGNLLLDLSRVNLHGLRFDESLGLAGGEDTLFTRSLVDSGEQIIWCEEAIVLDPVPDHRLTRRWVRRRVLFVSNASVAATIRQASVSRRVVLRARYLAMGLVRIVLGAGQGVAGVLTRSTGLRARATGARARGLGAALAALGIRLREYRR